MSAQLFMEHVRGLWTTLKINGALEVFSKTAPVKSQGGVVASFGFRIDPQTTRSEMHIIADAVMEYSNVYPQYRIHPVPLPRRTGPDGDLPLEFMIVVQK